MEPELASQEPTGTGKRTWYPRSEWGRRHWDAGYAHGIAKVVLAVLQNRGLSVDSDVKTRIAACADPEQLLEWVERAVVAERAEDIFA
ncbi:hypothetical protein [Actinomadura gamaensis]|uniref:Transposase n=1 Tax=Actinomadura gamaensis TaxID=1763541 RepID=A0ABV9TWW9_9ACTN